MIKAWHSLTLSDLSAQDRVDCSSDWPSWAKKIVIMCRSKGSVLNLNALSERLAVTGQPYRELKYEKAYLISS